MDGPIEMRWVKNKQGKFEGNGETKFNTLFMMQSHAENIKKIWEPFKIFQLTSKAKPAQFNKSWPNHSELNMDIHKRLQKWIE